MLLHSVQTQYILLLYHGNMFGHTCTRTRIPPSPLPQPSSPPLISSPSPSRCPGLSSRFPLPVFLHVYLRYECWDANAKVTKYKKDKGNWTNDDLYTMFAHRYAGLVNAHGKTRIGWEEMYDIGGKTAANDTETIVHVWTNNSKLANVVANGLRGIVSQAW